jgi:hypothetical protein
LNTILAQVEETFNDQNEFNVYEKGNDPEAAVIGYMKNHNHYRAVMEFARRLRFQNISLDKKVKKLLKDCLTKDFASFKIRSFIGKLREWGTFKKEKEPSPSNNAITAKDKAFKDKLAKARKGGFCVTCKLKSCITERKAEGTKTGVRWPKVPFKGKTEVNNTKTEDEDDEKKEVFEEMTNEISYIPIVTYQCFLLIITQFTNKIFKSRICIIARPADIYQLEISKSIEGAISTRP